MNNDWNAENYEVGAYIQHTVSQQFLDELCINEDADILDIGAGDGSFTLKLLERVPKGSVLATDRSDTMLSLCQKKTQHYPQLSTRKMDATTIDYHNAFDIISSFWCLHWVKDYVSVYEKIYDALRPGGQLLSIFSLGKDPMMSTYLRVKSSGKFPFLNDFVPPIDFSVFHAMENRLAHIPFKQKCISKKDLQIELPDLNTFHQFVKGVDFFYQNQLNTQQIEDITEAQVQLFEKDSQKNDGKYLFDLSISLITGIK